MSHWFYSSQFRSTLNLSRILLNPANSPTCSIFPACPPSTSSSRNVTRKFRRQGWIEFHSIFLHFIAVVHLFKGVVSVGPLINRSHVKFLKSSIYHLVADKRCSKKRGVYVNMNVCAHACVCYSWMYVCMRVCMYVCICACINVRRRGTEDAKEEENKGRREWERNRGGGGKGLKDEQKWQRKE